MFLFPENIGCDPEVIIARLDLAPHPEGGFFKETYRDVPVDGSRGAATQIYFLLREGERSAWHRIDGVEIWHFYAGAPLRLSLAPNDGPSREEILGKDADAGHILNAVVPKEVWQSAESLGGWTLVGCTVAPAFSFEGFELAPPLWTP